MKRAIKKPVSIGAALRAKYRTPRDAILALGLDESLLDASQLAYDGASNMKKPTRLEHFLLTTTARAVNPLLAMDAKVNYGPIFKGLTTANYKARVPTMIAGLRKAVAGKTIAKDASLEHVAKFLDTFEHTPKAEKSWDESVSGPQHRAMEAAAHGHSNIGIPKNVGAEYSDADKGKKFGDTIRDWAMSKGMSDDDRAALDKLLEDEMPGEAALDEEETNIEVEEGEDSDIEEEEAEDGDLEEEEAEDEIEEEEGEDRRFGRDSKKAKDAKSAKDRKAGKDGKAARDRKGAMDSKKRPITQDEMNKAIAAERQAGRAALEARALVRPFLGEMSLALDSAEKIYRSAAKALDIENSDTIHVSALPQMIKMAGRQRQQAHDAQMQHDEENEDRRLAMDEDASSFAKRFPGAARIQTM